MKKLDQGTRPTKRTVHVSMERGLHARIAKLAADGNRPFSRQVEIVLEKGLQTEAPDAA